MHRVGGLEKADGTGNVSYDPANHGLMTDLREDRIARIAEDLPALEVDSDKGATVLVVGWGSTWGAIRGAVRRLREAGKPIAHVHLTHIHPFAKNLGEILSAYDTVIVPELNKGQLVKLLRAEYLVDAQSLTKVIGQPFTAGEIEQALEEALNAQEES